MKTSKSFAYAAAAAFGAVVFAVSHVTISSALAAWPNPLPKQYQSGDLLTPGNWNALVQVALESRARLANNVYSKGGYVGIGTNEPAMKLHVQGHGRFSNSDENYVLVGHGGGNGFVGSYGAGNLDFRIDGKTKLTVGADGNIIVRNGALCLGDDCVKSWNDIATGGTGDSAWGVTGEDVYRIKGNVGIGTNKPDAKLKVWGHADKVAFNVNDAFTLDTAAGQGLTNLVAGAKINTKGTGYDYINSRGASRITLHDGRIQFHVGDTTGVAGQAVGFEEVMRLTKNGIAASKYCNAAGKNGKTLAELAEGGGETGTLEKGTLVFPASETTKWDWSGGCKNVTFSNSFMKVPTLLLSINHNNAEGTSGTSKHHPMTAWAERVSKTGVRICASDTYEKAPNHEAVTVQWVAFAGGTFASANTSLPTCAEGKILKYKNGEWKCANDATGGSTGAAILTASGQDVTGPNAKTNQAVINLADYDFDESGTDPHIIVSEHNFNYSESAGNTMDASYCGFEKISKLEFKVTCWASTNSSSSTVQSSFDWLAIQSSATPNSASGGSGKLDCKTVSAPLKTYTSGIKGTVQCPATYTMTGGGCRFNANQGHRTVSYNAPSGNGWNCVASGKGKVNKTYVYARCCKF
jgi:hypothetical protein